MRNTLRLLSLILISMNHAGCGSSGSDADIPKVTPATTDTDSPSVASENFTFEPINENNIEIALRSFFKYASHGNSLLNRPLFDKPFPAELKATLMRREQLDERANCFSGGSLTLNGNIARNNESDHIKLSKGDKVTTSYSNCTEGGLIYNGSKTVQAIDVQGQGDFLILNPDPSSLSDAYAVQEFTFNRLTSIDSYGLITIAHGQYRTERSFKGDQEIDIMLINREFTNRLTMYYADIAIQEKDISKSVLIPEGSIFTGDPNVDSKITLEEKNQEITIIYSNYTLSIDTGKNQEDTYLLSNLDGEISIRENNIQFALNIETLIPFGHTNGISQGSANIISGNDLIKISYSTEDGSYIAELDKDQDGVIDYTTKISSPVGF